MAMFINKNVTWHPPNAYPKDSPADCEEVQHVNMTCIKCKCIGVNVTSYVAALDRSKMKGHD